MPSPIVVNKEQIFIATVDPADGNDIAETFTVAGNLVYVPDQIVIPVTVSTAADATVIQITDSDDNVIFTKAVGTSVQVGTFNIILEKGTKEYYTLANGDEVIPLPDDFLIKGGWKLKSVAETVANTNFGKFTVFGHMAHLL